MEKNNIRKIAELAGVSASTVSCVLNNKPGVGTETRNKVLQIIEQENYSPGRKDPRSVLKRIFNIYLVIDEMTSVENLFYASILDNMVSIAGKNGYNIVMTNKFETFQSSSVANSIKQNTVDGIVFFHDIDTETLVFLRQTQVPFVVVDSHQRDAPYTRVCVNYNVAAYTATKYLIEQGHRDIGFISGTYIPDFYITTFHGFCRALSEYQILIRPQWLKSSACDFDTAYKCMDDILHCKEYPSAIVCSSDLFALAAMQCIQDYGYKIPKDFSVTGIDDLNISKIFYPALTTVHLNTQEIAQKAIDLLSKQITSQDSSLQETSFVVSDVLIIRSSSSRNPR